MDLKPVLSWIAPLQVPIGEDVDFTYRMQVEMEGVDSGGIERIAILTQWPADVDWNAISSTGQASVDAVRSYVTDDSLVVYFSPPVGETTELTVPFTSRLLSAKHSFSSFLYAPESQNPLKTDERTGVDAVSGEPFTVTVTTEDFEIPILQDVEAVPAVFTPNGDGINDRVSLRFTLGRMEGATLRLEVYTLSGQRVRTAHYEGVNAGRYGGGSSSALVHWDGRDDAGQTVEPGMYIYKLAVALDPTESVSMGSVGVAW